jgi:hypothetical protein
VFWDCGGKLVWLFLRWVLALCPGWPRPRFSCRSAPPCLAICWKCVCTFLPRLSSNGDPPHLRLSSSQYYSCESLGKKATSFFPWLLKNTFVFLKKVFEWSTYCSLLWILIINTGQLIQVKCLNSWQIPSIFIWRFAILLLNIPKILSVQFLILYQFTFVIYFKKSLQVYIFKN